MDRASIPDTAGLAAAVARVWVDPTLPERHLEEALCAAIADRRGYLGDWWVDGDSVWRVQLLVPDRETFGGRTLPQALAWCLVWVMGTRAGSWDGIAIALRDGSCDRETGRPTSADRCPYDRTGDAGGGRRRRCACGSPGWEGRP